MRLKEKCSLWNIKWLHLMSSANSDYATWYWPRCLKKEKKRLWKYKCQDHGERPNTQTKGLFVRRLRFMSVFQIIHQLNCREMANCCSATECTEHKTARLGAKYSCKTGLFHRFQPGNKISKMWAGAPSLPESAAWSGPCVLVLLNFYQPSVNWELMEW